MKTVITFGTFDVFHVGHLRLLQRARKLGERLLVGVSSDALNIAKKALSAETAKAQYLWLHGNTL